MPTDRPLVPALRTRPSLLWPWLAGAAIFVFLLFYLGAQPFAAGLIPPPWDKLAHFAAYAALAGLLSAGTAGRHPFLVIAAIWITGFIDEWHQMYLPGRFAELADFLADAGAAMSIVGLYEWRIRRLPGRLMPSCAE